MSGVAWAGCDSRATDPSAACAVVCLAARSRAILNFIGRCCSCLLSDGTTPPHPHLKKGDED